MRRLTRNRALDTAPAWSPDGRRIAFASSRDGGETEIYVMNADGSNERRLTRTARHVTDHTPAWAPDGSRIAFASTRAGFFNAEIFVMSPDGTHVRRLTFVPGSDTRLGDDSTPAWSAGGERIAFTSNRDQQGEIYVMNADGTGQTRLTQTSRIEEILPRFSPDEASLAFAGTDARGRSTLFVSDADGSGRRSLGRGADPAWRPVL